ncbi:hypothetical protein F5Y17DRAFT_246708 [Xylariaceae sp. FL0594]|nr:hypothetical protein F5Y17DRAFT_246708 [Xylariaceae sp. FL0594]
MCTEIYQVFQDPDCKHEEFQNSFRCPAMKEADPEGERSEPYIVPVKPPKIQPGTIPSCQRRKATKPMKGKCRRCRRKELLLSSPKDKKQDRSVSRSSPASGRSSDISRMPSFDDGSPLPDPRAWDKVQESFLEVTKKQRDPSSGSTANWRRERINTQHQLIEPGWITGRNASAGNFSFSQPGFFSRKHNG